ncbi:MAG: hypothetical protein KC496_06300 [Anaerolineae bacterium]|nr:hypothetical protein [Anaerolineae bacterium]
MAGVIGRVTILGWLVSVVCLFSALLLGRQFPAPVLMSWADSTPMNEAFIHLLDIRAGQSMAVMLPNDLLLAQQLQLQNCGANYHIVSPDSSTSTFFTWEVAGESTLTTVTYPQGMGRSTARIGRRSVSPDGRWLFLPYDRLGIVSRVATGEWLTLMPEEASVSTGQPGFWSLDSRWLLWPYELAGDRVRWLRFDSQTHDISQVEITGNATSIDDERQGIWSPDSRTFATIQRSETQSVLLLVDALTLEIRRIAFVGLAEEMVWSPDSSALILFANERDIAPLIPYRLDVATEKHFPLVDFDVSYPAPQSSRSGSYTPTWSPDGQLLTLFTGDDTSQTTPITLRIIQLDGQEQLAAPLPGRTRYPADTQFWSEDGGFFALYDRARGMLLRFNIRTGEMQEFGDRDARVIAALATHDALILVRAGRPGRLVERLPWSEQTAHFIRRMDGTQTVFSLCHPEP